MMTKQEAINILEDVLHSLNNKEDGISKALSTTNTYIKDLEVATDPKIKKLIEKQKQYISLYGEEDARTISINKKISKKMGNIFDR